MNTLRQKFGPLPVWGWLVLITALALGWYLYYQMKGGSSQLSGAAQTPETVNQVTIQQPAPPAEPRPKRKRKPGSRPEKPDRGKHKRRKPGKTSQPPAGGGGHHTHPATGHPHQVAASVAEAAPGAEDQAADTMAPDGQGHDGSDSERAA